MQIKQSLIIKCINATAHFAPFISARMSYQVWTSTCRHQTPEKERNALNSAVRQAVLVDGSQIMTYAWQICPERPLILLLHGWNGRATQLSSFISMLTGAGYGVVAFDARGHGLSEGRNTNVLESVAIIKKMSHVYGSFFAMIGHSFGAMSAVNAIKAGVECEKLIAISPPTEFSALIEAFFVHLKINLKARNVLEAHVLKKYNIASFEQISITGIAPDMSIPCLFIHDEDDDKVPLSQSQKAVECWGKNRIPALKEAGAKLRVTQGLGHVRILHKPPALQASIEFLQGVG